jgi:hypothetical protein
MPAAPTTKELDMIRLAKQAMNDLDVASPGAARVLARQRLERIQIGLEKGRDPNVEALRLIKQSLGRPIDPQSAQKAAANGRSDSFNKLMKPAGSAALAK